ncbi:MAG TPA: ABC-2 family transporter protein [Ktedonobacterales bacterium]|nr:ABC-2 family transporter protein [Ktedonobacterales bacterium]
MLESARDDLRLYRHLVMQQVRAQAQYKANLATDILTYFCVTFLEFSAVLILFGPFPTLAGWSVGEVALLYGLTSICFGFAELFGAGIDLFSETIRRGEFDRVLLRPAGVLLQVATSDFKLRRLGRITEGIAIVLLALRLLPHGLHWTAAKVLLVGLGIGSGAVIFISILLLGATFCFWTVETTELTNILTYGGREMMSWPLHIYNAGLRAFFLFVVPLAFGTYLPACYLLDRPPPFGLPPWAGFAAPVTALLFGAGARAAWSFGVRHYQSTGN